MNVCFRVLSVHDSFENCEARQGKVKTTPKITSLWRPVSALVPTTTLLVSVREETAAIIASRLGILMAATQSDLLTRAIMLTTILMILSCSFLTFGTHDSRYYKRPRIRGTVPRNTPSLLEHRPPALEIRLGPEASIMSMIQNISSS